MNRKTKEVPVSVLIIRKYFLMVAILLVAGCFSVACDGDDSGSDLPTRFYAELRIGGRVRTYLVNIPENIPAQQKLPVVFMFHGTGGSAEQAERDYGWTAKSNANQFIVVYPEGVAREGRFHVRTWNAGKCCDYAMVNNVDDVAFVNSLLDHLVENYPVDETRVYAAGMSNGAMLAYRLACELPDKFAAIAAVSGTMMVDRACTSAQGTALLHIHSLVDTKIPYNGGTGIGGYYFTPVDSAINVFKTIKGCTESSLTETPGYKHEVIRNCSDGSVIETFLLYDGGHSWPGGQRASPRSDVPSTAIRATDVIWEFFTAHTL